MTPTITPPTRHTEWRLLDEVGAESSAERHMRADLDLLADVLAGGQPSLRLYTWSVPTLSLGRFQPIDDVDHDACRRLGVDVVQRPTGGAALLHGGDLTYSVAMPLAQGAAGSVRAVYGQVANALITGLARLGVAAAVARHRGAPGPVCFAGQQGADLRVGPRKLCGSAQMRRRGAVLQHGSILLRRLAIDECDVITDACDRASLQDATVTLEELGAPCEARRVADAIVAGFTQELGIRLTPTTLVGQAIRATR